METVIYGDVLVAVNFIINLMVLGLTRKLTGIPVKRYRRYLGALVGALCSFVIFLPLEGLPVDLAIRLGVTVLVVLVTYYGQPVRNLLRLSVVFFGVGFLLAGFIIAIWFLLPRELLAYAHGILYLDVQPLVLVGCVSVAYLFVSLFDRVFDGGRGREGTWRAVVARGGNSVELQLFMDTGNHLIEPFSGLPVMVAGLEELSPLLSVSERGYILGQSLDLPPGLRPVFFQMVGGDGLLYAFRPDSIRLYREGRVVEGEGYLAVSVKELHCQGCSGIFNPRLLGVGIESKAV